MELKPETVAIGTRFGGQWPAITRLLPLLALIWVRHLVRAGCLRVGGQGQIRDVAVDVNGLVREGKAARGDA